jgi:hypothetical protein
MGASLDIIGRCGEASNVYDLAKSAWITIETIAVPCLATKNREVLARSIVLRLLSSLLFGSLPPTRV